ncbi:peptidylprolyl isomerase [Rheinheimera sp. YQF-2]|uniref:Peptidyl-prolyl cis-trans isomerase n=1 Tax=Rheinheimera lutimaris TaxID=2740584 RepID=A0A7Y5AM96_9GAMM|nr:peptidylprolyl isomerase [Rheinheimera lutimaris]NRQ40998.1 peptidylprolyl isomerase [Rheinheimera lutimaris]
MRYGLSALILLLASTWVQAGQFLQANNLFPKVRIITSHGDIDVELDRSRAPLTVNNFLSYVKHKRYNNTVFHRLEPEFVLQGGGYDASYKPIEELKPVFNESGNGLKNQFGTIAMARLAEPHSATSQFYFNLQDNPSLDPGRRWGYTVFGRISAGEDVIEKIRAIQTDTSAELGWPNVPVEPVLIKTVLLLPEQ